MTIEIDLQIASKAENLPTAVQFQRWVSQALAGRMDQAVVTIRIVDEAESAKLNKTYRHKTGPTNILSFPFEAPKNLELNLLGDLVICAPIVAKEATEQKKALDAHWAHLTVHGILHLLGYDHIEEADATEMEALEIAILAQIKVPNPYL